jgi:hypothetical protein
MSCMYELPHQWCIVNNDEMFEMIDIGVAIVILTLCMLLSSSQAQTDVVCNIGTTVSVNIQPTAAWSTCTTLVNGCEPMSASCSIASYSLCHVILQ